MNQKAKEGIKGQLGFPTSPHPIPLARKKLLKKEKIVQEGGPNQNPRKRTKTETLKMQEI